MCVLDEGPHSNHLHSYQLMLVVQSLIFVCTIFIHLITNTVTTFVCVCVCKWPSCKRGLAYMSFQWSDPGSDPPDMAKFLDKV